RRMVGRPNGGGPPHNDSWKLPLLQLQELNRRVGQGRAARRNREAAMPDRGGYGQFCPVAMAAEILCSRWTVPVVREFLAGSTRFNELRKGVPRMSPALLARRLRDLEEAGIVRRVPAGGGHAYQLTPAGLDLRECVERS